MTYSVVVSKTQNSSYITDQSTKNKKGLSFKEAYNHYGSIVNDLGLNNAEWSGAEMELSAGGRGYDYQVELKAE